MYLTNLPQQLTSFVGREPELGEVGRLLASGRLLTLTGTGGCGKTRLALELAARSMDDFPGGVFIVELASLTDPSLILQAVASVLGVREEPPTPLIATLSDHLQPLQMLLILDSCEHLVDSCSALAGVLLRAAPMLKILATSRHALDVPGEIRWRVPSLRRPNPASVEPLEALAEYEAVRLFVDRARLKRSDFVLTRHNARAVALLCYRLDGIPLAIELAAARITVLTVEQIVARLDERFKLLTEGNRTELLRHQTLVAAMDWSYELLRDEERALLRGLSVFAGGFSIEAAEAVCGPTVQPSQVLDLLSHLVDKSLVAVDQSSGAARYSLLETVRQYALEKMEYLGEGPALRERHYAWYAQLAEESEPSLMSDKQAEWLARLEQEHDNLLAALAWSREEPGNHLVALAGALVWFWYFRGYISEARIWLEAAVEHPFAQRRSSAYLRALTAAGTMAFLQSRFTLARSHLETSVALGRELGEDRNVAYALAFLGRVVQQQGEPNARDLVEQSVDVFRSSRDKFGLALALDFLGFIAGAEGDADVAASLHQESLTLFHSLSNPWGIALELSTFGRFALARGDYQNARARLEQALHMQRSVGDKWSIAWMLNSLGNVLRLEGENEPAVFSYEESLRLFRELDDSSGAASCLHALGLLAMQRGDFERAEGVLQQGLDLFRAAGDEAGICTVAGLLGQVESYLGNIEMARQLCKEALEMAGGLGTQDSLVEALKGFALLARASTQADSAATLFAAAESLGPGPTGTVLSPPLPTADNADGLRLALGEDLFLRAWQRGSHMTRAQAFAFALRSAGYEPDPSVLRELDSRLDRAPAAPENDADLSDRELEVLRLVARGLTDAKIASCLDISIRTVQSHIRSIHSKLGVPNRSVATRYALEHGLV